MIRRLMPQRATALPRRVAQPLQEFLQTEAAGGVLLLAAALAALVWANAPFGSTYFDFWETHLAIDLHAVSIDESLQQWVNDGLMAIFFFVVGLEVKRELVRGELSEPRKAALPAAAALGGMAAPALIYLAFNAGGAGQRGWGIPMATDIAFAVGVVALVGPRVPSSLRAFLLALAIVDDIGAIVVIALFYSSGIDYGWLAVGAGCVALAAVLGARGVRPVMVYAVAGVVAWYAVLQSGVHPTVAGIALGLLTPAGAARASDRFGEEAQALAAAAAPDRAAAIDERSDARSAREALAREPRPLLDRFERALHPWSSFVIVPVFALANAGIAIDAASLREAVHSPVSIGVAVGLAVGKPAGILLLSWLTVRVGVAALPGEATWRQMVALTVVAGIGFTVSLFIAALAFTDPALQDEAKLGILGGSLAMGLAGYAALRLVTRESDPQMDTDGHR